MLLNENVSIEPPRLVAYSFEDLMTDRILKIQVDFSKKKKLHIQSIEFKDAVK